MAPSLIVAATRSYQAPLILTLGVGDSRSRSDLVRCCDLQGVIAERFGIQVHERTGGQLLRRLHLTRLQPRPHSPKRDEAAQEVFKKTFPAW